MWKLILIVFLNQSVQMQEIGTFNSINECRASTELIKPEMIPAGATKLVINCLEVE